MFATCHLLPHAYLGMMSLQNYTSQVILGCETVNINGFFDRSAPRTICLKAALLQRERGALQGSGLGPSALADWAFALFL